MDGPSPIPSEADDSIHVSRRHYEMHSIVGSLHSPVEADIESDYTIEYSRTPESVTKNAIYESSSREVSQAIDNEETIQNRSIDGVDVTDITANEQHYAIKSNDTTNILEAAIDAVGTKYSEIPPHSVRHAQYPNNVKSLYKSEPRKAFTQVLIWCLQRRISTLKRTPPIELKRANGAIMLRILETIQQDFMDEKLEIDPEKRIRPFKLNPTIPNSINVRCQEIIAQLEQCNVRLTEELNKSAIFYAESENKLHDEKQKTIKFPTNDSKDYDGMINDIKQEINDCQKALEAEMQKINAILDVENYKVVRALERRNRVAGLHK